MKIPHSPHHWIPVAIVIAAAVFTLSEAHGQHSGTAAVFEGRPAMAGAQAGLGAQAGPPQGGLGVQGSDDAQLAVTRRPRTVTTPRSAIANPDSSVVAADNANKAGADRDRDVSARSDVRPRRDDSSLAKDSHSAVRKTRKAARRTLERARHGTSPVDAQRAGS